MEIHLCMKVYKNISSLEEYTVGLAENDQNSPKSQKHSTSVEFQCKIEF